MPQIRSKRVKGSEILVPAPHWGDGKPCNFYLISYLFRQEYRKEFVILSTHRPSKSVEDGIEERDVLVHMWIPDTTLAEQLWSV